MLSCFYVLHFQERGDVMPKVMQASKVRVPKTFRIQQETLDSIEELQKKEGLSQGKILDLAIQLLRREKELAQ